ncbi:MAG TPA: YCF48-related protein [Ruminiclostridium sp.]|nr:YCF48-related protein [Ruminiclostridium sp.]
MNKHLLSLLLLLTFTLPLSAQWTWQNPLPPGNGFRDVQFIDSLNGWACGDSKIAKTTDGGQNWILLNAPPTNNYFVKLFFASKNKGFIHSTGDNSQTYVTNDGGISWDVVTPLSNKYLPRMQFLNEKVGYVLQFWETGFFDFHLFKTTDGGKTWNNYDPVAASLRSYSFFFLDENYGWVDTDGGIARTTDAGKTWQRSFIPAYAEVPIVEQIQFINKKQGFAAGNPSNTNSLSNHNFFAYTTDGGATWNNKWLPDTDVRLNSVHFVSGNTGYVTTNESPHGRIFYTTDLGTTWRTLETTAGTFSFVDSLRAWGIDGGNIVFTTDGWMTTRPSSVTASTLNSVSVLDTNNIAAAGAYSTIVLSNDGGKTWEKSLSSNSDSVSLQSIFYKNSNEIWAAGSRSSVLWSTDKGKNWNKINLDALNNRFNDIAFPDDTTGFIIGGGTESGIIYAGKAAQDKSSLIWQKAKEFPFVLNKIKFTKAGTGYIAGGTKIMKSTDRGLTWKELQMPVEATFYTLDAIDNYVWTVAGKNILVSTDAGSTWNSIKAFDYFGPNPSAQNVRAMAFADTLNGALGLVGRMIRTTDGGLTWKEDNKIPSIFANSLDFADNGHAWAAGYDGMILYYNAQLTNANEDSDVEDLARLSSYSLGQNYPNPFNPQTTIRYSITTMGIVSLKIYDILGNEIAALINEIKSPGTYNISFDASKYRLSSGVYIYRLQVNDYTASKKLLFLK